MGEIEAWMNVCWGGGGGMQFILDKFSCHQVKTQSIKETSEIIWPNPLIFQMPSNLGIILHEIQVSISENM